MDGCGQVASARPRVLVFTGFYLPGYKAGGILRSVINAVSHLHRHFDFHIVTRDRDLGENEPYDGIRTEQWQQVGDATVCYLPPERQSSRTLRELLLTTPHDLLRLNSFFDPLTVKVLYNLRRGRVPRKPVVLSPFGEFAWPSLKQKYPKKAVFIGAARLAGLYDSVLWHASNPAEAEDIARVMHVSARAIRVVEDLPTVWTAETRDIQRAPRPAGQGLRIAFFSRISPEKNLDFALTVLARVRAKVQFDIIGPIENVPYWQKCEAAIARLPENVTARALGSIRPDQVLTTLGDYDLMFLPTGGEGFGHVISESLMAGTPVLISTNTPWRDLPSRRLGWDLPLDDAGPFVGVIEELAKSTDAQFTERRATVTDEMRRYLAASPRIDEYRRMLHDALVGSPWRA